MFKHYRSEPLTEPEKRYLRKKNGVKSRFAVDLPVSDKPKTERDYLCPTNITTTISRRKRRGFNGCKMSHANKLLVLSRADARLEFLRSIGAKV
jgi:hypothetical protein